MQKILQITVVFTGAILFWIIFQGCRKDKIEENPNSWTEDFKNVHYLLQKQWLIINNSIDANDAYWKQGIHESYKIGETGFPAYSCTATKCIEYAFAGQTNFSSISDVSSWLITPVIHLKNDDTFSFYTRCDSAKLIAPHGLEVRLSTVDFPNAGTSPSDIGTFTNLLYSVNPNKTMEGFPKSWKKIEVTISGLAGVVKGRIAFRYLAQGQLDGGIGIDQLVYTSK